MYSSATGSERLEVPIPWLFMLAGNVIAITLVFELLYLYWTSPDLFFEPLYLLSVLTTIPFAIVIVYGGYWLTMSSITRERYGRIVVWCVGGLCVSLALSGTVLFTGPSLLTVIDIAVLRWFATIGAGVGLFVGILEAGEIVQAVTAERAVMRANHLEEQRDLLEYLNAILRHEILNTATIINGFAIQLRDGESSINEDDRDRLGIIVQESEEMTSVIDDVRALLHATEQEYSFRPVNLSVVLETEIAKLQHRWDTVEWELAIPPDVYVQADELVARVFNNLLSNAIEHNPNSPRVSVSVTRDAGMVTIGVADNGPGIQNEDVESLYERKPSKGSSHGLGLYLVDKLIDRYDGAIELAHTDDTGSVFMVELPAANPPVGIGSGEQQSVMH